MKAKNILFSFFIAALFTTGGIYVKRYVSKIELIPSQEISMMGIYSDSLIYPGEWIDAFKMAPRQD